MDILLVFLVIAGVIYFMGSGEIVTQKKQEAKCPPHSWVYQTQPGTDEEYLVCEKCKMLPGGMYVE